MKQVVIVAGGSGSRMNSELPKQFLSLNNKPILIHTIEVFLQYDRGTSIFLVLPEAYHSLWRELKAKYLPAVEIKLIAGGKERFFSVQNALPYLNDKGVIVIHDGVRPLVSTATLDRCFTALEKHNAIIPVLPVVESLRKVNGLTNEHVDRANYVTVQTPQCFTATILKEAYRQAYSTKFTDDASVVEALGVTITTVEGNTENIKITTPSDLIIATALLSR